MAHHLLKIKMQEQLCSQWRRTMTCTGCQEYLILLGFLDCMFAMALSMDDHDAMDGYMFLSGLVYEQFVSPAL